MAFLGVLKNSFGQTLLLIFVAYLVYFNFYNCPSHDSMFFLAFLPISPFALKWLN
jgi:hypothetical protein